MSSQDVNMLEGITQIPNILFLISNPISLRSTDGCNKKIYNLARETFKGKEEHKNKKFQEIRKSEQLRATIQT